MSSSDITQACISISITLDIGWWVIRCRHYCTTSSILGETQLSRLEHTAIVSTICYQCHTPPTNKPTTTFQTFNQPSDLDLQTHCHAWINFLEYCLGIHIQTMFKAGGILQCSSGGGWEGGHIAAWELPGATCTWTPELPSPGFTPCSYTALQRHTHTVAHSGAQWHTHTHSGSTWSRPGLWLPTGRQ